jgi:hypothetical protein
MSNLREGLEIGCLSLRLVIVAIIAIVAFVAVLVTIPILLLIFLAIPFMLL